MPTPVILAQRQHLEREVRWGGYRAAALVEEEAAHLYPLAAELVGAEPDEIAFVDSATRAWDLALLSLPWRLGDQILTSRLEYASNALSFLHLSRRRGVDIVVAPTDDDGVVDVAALADRIGPRTSLIALTHIPTHGGAVQPAVEVGQLAREAEVPFLLDACQSVGQVDVRDVPWDLLSATGRKYLRGPRGTGFLGIRRALLEQLQPPIVDLCGATWTAPEQYELRPDARRYELWERSWGGQLGLVAAIRGALDIGIEPLQERIAALGATLRTQLADVGGVEVHDRGKRLGGIVTFTGPFDPVAVRDTLRAESIHVSVSSASSALLDLREDRGLEQLVRASVHAFNTEEELDRFVTCIEAIAAGRQI